MWILRNITDEIVSFSDGDFVLAAGQTQEEISGTMVDYEARFIVSVDKPKIAADNTDEALVTIDTNLVVASIDVRVNGVLVNVAIAAGTGTLPPIVSAVPTLIAIEPDDKTVYSPAGQGSITVEAI